MIPIRNFPYSDYHDLNLDYLLRKFAIFEVDLEDLKRRVKALEDWREIAEPTIANHETRIISIENTIINLGNRLTIVEGDIVDIKGDIVNIKNDIVDIKGDIVTILDNSTSFFFDFGSGYVRPDAVNNSTIYNLTASVQFYREFIERLFRISTRPEIGGVNYDFYIKDSNHIIKAEYDYNRTTGTLKITAKESINDPSDSVVRYFNVLEMIYEIENDNVTFTNIKNNIFPVLEYNITLLGGSYWRASSDPDFPYYQDVAIDGVNINSEGRFHFESLSDFKTYSEILCDYVVSDQGIFTFYATEEPSTDINLKAYINC